MGIRFTKKKIGILDYGVGNLYSLQKALDYIGGTSELVSSSTNLKSYSGIILPGVGSFGVAMGRVRAQGLAEVLKEWVALDRPVLGICLGMQLLFSSSEEQGCRKGLNLIPGTVERLKTNLELGQITKVPNIGWRSLEISNHSNAIGDTLFSDIQYENEYYFLHSYACFPAARSNIIAYSTYGGNKFAAVVRKDNIFGCQFHPEKSRSAGIQFLENYFRVI
jgi:glutamine amidotransferase